MKPITTAQEEEDRILSNLLRETIAGSVRWGFQPPSTIQANQGKLHYVLRVRRSGRTMYKLTGRRDGSKTVNLMIERVESETDPLTQIYQYGTKERT